MDPTIARELDGAIASLLPELTSLRRDLHAHPQLAYQETYASSRVQEWLARAGVPFEAGVATTGVVGWLLPEDPSRRVAKAVLLRADMDALPIREETRLPYASTFPGVMHACGHDGHTAMLTGAAAVLSRLRSHLPRPVKFLFQPAEEGGAGALRMIEAGALEKKIGGVEAGLAFALHVRADLALGALSVCPGPCGAGSDEIHIRITGRGGHAARPERAADPVLAAAAVVMNLHTIVSRNVAAMDAAVLTIAQVHGGSKDNIIPPDVELGGTVRTFREEVRRSILARIEEVVSQTAAALGCRGEFRLCEGYPVLVNEERAARYAAEIARSAAGEANLILLPPSMGAEDFAFVARRVPACLLRIGMQAPGAPPHAEGHSPLFDFNDQAIPLGVRLLCLLALRAGEMEGE